MKKVILICILSILGISSVNAQYYYNPYGTAVAIAETNETYQLNNIKFDINEISKNPVALNEYNCYVERHNNYVKKAKNGLVWGYVGCGAMILGCIPMCSYNNDAAFYSGCAIVSIGAVVGTIGYCCYIGQMSNIKYNKKNFIYYLKTTNNGIGIVTIF